MKKYIIACLGITAFAVAYYFTGSWKLSLIILGIAVLYLISVIGIELGLSSSQEEKNERNFTRMKNEHKDHTKKNPTLR